jgi:DNA topoisomerase I
VTDGETNATLPKAVSAEAVTLDEAIGLLNARRAMGPSKKKTARKSPAKKAASSKKAPATAAAKKTATKKTAAKKVPAKKAASKTTKAG